MLPLYSPQPQIGLSAGLGAWLDYSQNIWHFWLTRPMTTKAKIECTLLSHLWALRNNSAPFHQMLSCLKVEVKTKYCKTRSGPKLLLSTKHIKLINLSSCKILVFWNPKSMPSTQHYFLPCISTTIAQTSSAARGF